MGDAAVARPRSRTLVALGSLLEVNPDRCVLKKVVLSGLPQRVKKRGAVVKTMFYNPRDVNWFKPLELWTKHGCTGAIREPVGTHGFFKAFFNKPIKQHDTICLSLYKRVYPKMLGDGNKARAVQSDRAVALAVGAAAAPPRPPPPPPQSSSELVDMEDL